MEFANNNSGWSNHFLRRMLAWVCRNRHIGLLLRDVHRVTFRRSGAMYGGTAWGWNREIVIGIGDAKHYPVRFPSKPRRVPREGTTASWHDRLEALIAVTAHEVMHVAQYISDDHKCSSKGRGMETQANHVANLVLLDFRQQRAVLVADWARGGKVRPPAVKLSAPQRRAENARRKLAEWEKKQRAAERLTTKWGRKVRYYENQGTYDAIAAMRGEPERQRSAATSPPRKRGPSK